MEINNGKQMKLTTFPFKIDLIVWKSSNEGSVRKNPQSFKIDLIVWKYMRYKTSKDYMDGLK